MTLSKVWVSSLHGVRDHSASQRGDHSLAADTKVLSEAAETRFLPASGHIPLLRQPVAIDRVRAGFSGMYALPLADGSLFSASLTTTQPNVGDAGLVSSRGREVASVERPPLTVN